MSEGVIVALIGCAATLVGSVLTFIFEIKKLRVEQAKYQEEVRESHQKQFEELKKTVNGKIDGLEDSIKEMKFEYEKQTALTTEKLSQLEKKQDKHNNLIERMYAAEKDIEVLKNREKVSEHRLEDLEDKD
jgi:chromosome segregation ATPase